MNCPRCQGFLTTEYIKNEVETEHRPCYKCINCGFRNDLTYMVNRKNQYESHQTSS